VRSCRRRFDWSKVDLSRPAALVINQNTDSGWGTPLGTINRTQPILTVDLPAGHHTVTVTHSVRGLAAGALLTLLGIAASVWIVRRATPERVDGRRDAAARRLLGLGVSQPGT
jgi:hypothetical protein